MAREGMDAGAVRQVAAQLEQDAAAVDHVVAAVDGLFQSIERDWKGSDSTRLHEQWVGQRRGEFNALAAALRKMATTARANATDQDKASGVASTAGGMLGKPPFVPPTGPLWGSPAHASLPPGVLGLLGVLGAVPGALGPILGTPDIPGHIFDSLKASKITSWVEAGKDGETRLASLEKNAVNVIDHDGSLKLASRSSEVLKGVGIASSIVGGISVGASAVQATSDFAQGNYGEAAEHTLDGTASALKMSKNPTAYLLGFDISLYSDVVKDYRAIDWSQPLPMPTPSNLVHDYVPAILEGERGALSTVWKDL